MGLLEELLSQPPYTEAMRCGWLNDLEWLTNFQWAVRNIHSVAGDLFKHHALPGYPLPWQAYNLSSSYSLLKYWIERSLTEFPHRLAESPTFGVSTNVHEAWMWAASLIAASKLKRFPRDLNPASFQDRSWIPTQAEVESWQCIVELLSHYNFKGSLPAPRWDRKSRKLSYGEIPCRKYVKEAPNQFKILDAFQAADWPNYVDSPFPGNQSRLTEAIQDLNEKLTEESPIRFRGSWRPEWYPKSNPQSPANSS